MTSLDQILHALQRFQQRATYGAVGAVVGWPARSVMLGRPRDPLHSWVVRKSDGQPTGYDDRQKDPDLLARSRVITSGQELSAWLEAPG
jgi:hypothetical protein